jgi:hypothetical protein
MSCLQHIAFLGCWFAKYYLHSHSQNKIKKSIVCCIAQTKRQTLAEREVPFMELARVVLQISTGLGHVVHGERVMEVVYPIEMTRCLPKEYR